jgi:flagellar biosynthetic protein FlhB
MSRFEGKTEAPSDRRKRKAKSEGRASARSPEVASAISLLLVVGASGSMLPSALDRLTTGMRTLIAGSGRGIPTQDVQAQALSMLGGALGPLLGAAVAVGIAGGLLQSGFSLAPAALKPKLSRLSLKQGIQRLKPTTVAWDAARSCLKITLLAAMSYGPIAELIDASRQARSLSEWLSLSGAATRGLMIRGALLAGIIAAADLFVSRRRTSRSLKMSKQEVKQEHKESEGDPLMKSLRRRRQNDLRRQSMIADVATADVVVMNPTHYAVALRYEAGEPAPRVVAKGMDHFALKIRKVAHRNGVLVQEDPPLARALHRSCKVGQFVPTALFEAVAIVLALAYRRRARGVA